MIDRFDKSTKKRELLWLDKFVPMKKVCKKKKALARMRATRAC